MRSHAGERSAVEGHTLVPLPIAWERLVTAEGQTCARCAATRVELERAVAALESALAPLGIQPTLEFRVIDARTFAADPSTSNRVWIGGKLLEDWVAGTVVTSPCSSACGGAECRQLELGGGRYEAVPAALIVKAALLAAAELVGALAP